MLTEQDIIIPDMVKKEISEKLNADFSEMNENNQYNPFEEFMYKWIRSSIENEIYKTLFKIGENIDKQIYRKTKKK